MFNSTDKITVRNDMDFTVDGFAMRVYNNKLWCDGGEQDDFLIREIPELVESDERDAEVELTITASDLEHMAFFSANYEEIDAE